MKKQLFEIHILPKSDDLMKTLSDVSLLLRGSPFFLVELFRVQLWAVGCQ